MESPFDYDVAVVGAGPAGIGTAVALERLDVEYAVLERDRIGASFRQWPDEMRLLTPSFPGNAFGVRDLNAITPDTSPALALDVEHPTGNQYAGYLEAVADFHEVPIRTGVDVERVVPTGSEAGFRLETDGGSIDARYVVWAGGEFQYPADGSIPGASYGVHVAAIDSWSSYTERVTGSQDAESEPRVAGTPAQQAAADGGGAVETTVDGGPSLPQADDVVVVGGYESGIDAALGLADAGLSVTVIDDDGTWKFRSQDPSEVLSPRTNERLEAALSSGKPIDLVGGVRAARIERVDADDASESPGGSEFVLETTDGERIGSRTPPILATGFEGSLTVVDELFEFEDATPVLTDRDESKATPGLFLAGPQLVHDGQQFCFIYKFRQRFAVVAETIGKRLGVETSPLDIYREKRMFLEDLSCCEPEYCDC